MNAAMIYIYTQKREALTQFVSSLSPRPFQATMRRNDIKKRQSATFESFMSFIKIPSSDLTQFFCEKSLSTCMMINIQRVCHLSFSKRATF